MTPTSSAPPHTRQLTPADLTQVVELQRAVTATLPPGYVFPRTESDLHNFVNGTLGVAYGVFEGHTLAASSLLRIPSATHPNDASRPFPIMSEDDWALYAAGLANTIVLPTARGRGYQRTLVDARIAHAKSAGMKWIWSGVHLANSVSWSNLISKGMAIVGILTDFGFPLIGLLRRVEGVPLAVDDGDRMVVAAHQTSQHQEAMHNGYVGVRTTSEGSVLYYRLCAPDDARQAAVLYRQNHRFDRTPMNKRVTPAPAH